MSAARLPSVSGRTVIKALERAGFQVIRVKGSHYVLRHTEDASRQTVVPVHASRDLGRGLLLKILKEARLSQTDFEALL
jgi:predicted RNA binding protein YcfA (HicA-like mRNA interferase family)